jgi:UDP-glucose:(heptosyl)LPS alpha-1,3-glucosyltransferase
VLAAEKKMFESPGLKAVICNSAMVRDEIVEHFDIDAKKCHVIYSGVDTSAYHPGLREKHRVEMRRQLGVNQDENVLLYVGSGFFRKGLKAIIEALGKMDKPPTLIVVGHDRHLQKYKKQARVAGLQDRVIFAGPQKEVQAYYGLADAFILPSIYDPFPNAVLEAMACGLPIITSYNTGAAEFIEEGVQGYVVDAFNSDSLSAAIEKLSDPAHALLLGKQAREKVESFDLGSMADKLVKFYTEITQQSS